MPEWKIVARIHTDFATKFGVPRQSGLADTHGTIVFEPEYRNKDALRGIEEYSHLWLLWQFSEAVREDWSPTVRPPRLGGNRRVGVFATRSPYRPNAIGLSSVKLESVEWDTPNGAVLHVVGADLMDGTPIFDIKPYLAYTDSHPDAIGGFADRVRDYALNVVFPPEWEDKIPEDERRGLRSVLAGDPRPSYQNDPERVYGFTYAGREIRFTVCDGTLTVVSVE